MGNVNAFGKLNEAVIKIKLKIIIIQKQIKNAIAIIN